MEDISCTAKGAGQGDSGAVADAAIILAESDTARDANTGGADEESASAASLPTTSCSEFYSARIESMLSSRSEFETELEYWTAHSKEHWSELTRQEGASSSEESGSGSGEAGTGSGDQCGVDDRQYFEELQRNAIWGEFCSAVADVVLVKKLGEGAQGVIYEAQVTFTTEATELRKELPVIDGLGAVDQFVVKVMKPGYALQDLHRQWPQGLAAVNLKSPHSVVFSLFGALVKDHATGRSQFGFVMPKLWGDLRRLIDLRMERNNGKGPPFSAEQGKRIIRHIAFHMVILHGMGITHRDLKAANVLVLPSREEDHCDLGSSYDLVSSDDPHLLLPLVADWECSVGVVGTGFWRAPELLRQLKDRTPSSELVLTEETDVYSFAMTCYEIVTGKLPFEDLPLNYETRDAILDGARPKLPHDIDSSTKDIITRCWDQNPSDRPSFLEIFCGCLNARYLL